MSTQLTPPELARRPDWGWKIALVLDSPELVSEIRSALTDTGAAPLFELPAATAPFEVASAVEREKPDILFVEMSRAARPPGEWMAEVRRGGDTPLVIAVHPMAEPSEMISALRAGASEFLCIPVQPAIFEALDRISAILESRRAAAVEPGKISGILAPKGGCGATSFACFLSVALRTASPSSRVLVADLDHQSPGMRHIFRAGLEPDAVPRKNAADALEAVRRLSSISWREFVTTVAPGVDLLASPRDAARLPDLEDTPPEQWRMESLFRFIRRQYNWILADLGRHLNPASWTALQNIDDLYVVTAPDVLALYQTRSILQTLSSRGFDKSRVKIILNRNLSSPQDFWVESIQQMFEMAVFGIIPNDEAALDKLPRDRFVFPADTPFGRAITKIAARLVQPGDAPGSVPSRKAA